MRKWLFFLVFLLMGINWGLEARKWQLLITPIQPISFFRSFKAVLSGLSFSLFLPKGMGEYVGRLLYMQEGNRLRSIAVTVVGSMSQFIVTMCAGLMGLVYLRTEVFNPIIQLEGLPLFWLNGLMYVLSFGIMLLLLIYFRLSWFTKWFEKIPLVSRHKIFVENLEDFHWKDLMKILSLSIFRFIVFIMQYLLILYIFKVEVNWVDASWTTCVLFLALAIVPTIPIAELGLRGEISIQLFGLLSSNTLGIVATAASIWVVNLIIPSLAGSLFILGVKLFRNK